MREEAVVRIAIVGLTVWLVVVGKRLTVGKSIAIPCRQQSESLQR